MEPNEAMKAMARRIVKAHYPEMSANYRGRRYQIALAAIMETQEAIASFVETHAYFSNGPNCGMEPSRLARDDRHHATIARYIRAGEHYALTGGGRG